MITLEVVRFINTMTNNIIKMIKMLSIYLITLSFQDRHTHIHHQGDLFWAYLGQCVKNHRQLCSCLKRSCEGNLLEGLLGNHFQRGWLHTYDWVNVSPSIRQVIDFEFYTTHRGRIVEIVRVLWVWNACVVALDYLKFPTQGQLKNQQISLSWYWAHNCMKV